jgi:hypothetical protein
MTELPRQLHLRSAIALLVWLTMTIGLVAIGLRDHYEEQHFLEAIAQAAKSSSVYEIGPNPFDQPRRMSFMHLDPYLLAVIGIAGSIIVVFILAKDSERSLRLLGTSFLWQAFPTLCWLYSYWDGPSNFFTAAEVSALVLAPIASGFVHRSWKIAAVSVGLPIIACGIMWAGFMWLMGNGR